MPGQDIYSSFMQNRPTSGYQEPRPGYDQGYVPGYGFGAQKDAVQGSGGLPGWNQFFYGNHSGVPKQMAPGFTRTAGYIMAGSQSAEQDMRRAYEEAFQARAAGLVGGQRRQEQRLGGEMESQGLSGDMLRRQMLSQRSGVVGQLGEARAQGAAGLYGDLGELHKGTATELAGLSQAELMLAIQAYLAKKSRSAATKGAMIGAIGQIAGAAASSGASAAGGV